MQALMKTAAAPGLVLQEVAEPEFGSHDVLIRIHNAAICGTDLHIYKWDAMAQSYCHPPLIIGHEFFGEIVAIGDAVQGFHLGQRVSGEAHIGCGYCRNCRSGRSHLCRVNDALGATRHGCFAEYLALPAGNVCALPDAISNETGAILDPLGNATHTALQFNLVGEDVLITGAGPVGLMAAAIARHVGARYVVISDISPYRLALAREMGHATLALDLRTANLPDAMKQLGMREGFDVGLEMSGSADAINQMIAHMNHAGRIALLGFLPVTTQIDWSRVIFKGLQLQGIYGRQMFETWYKMVSMLQSGLNVSKVITHQFHFTEFEKAFALGISGQSGKILLRWQ